MIGRRKVSTLILCCMLTMPAFARTARSAPPPSSSPPPAEVAGIAEIQDWQVRLELARLLSYEKRYREALAEYEKVLKAKPKMVTARMEMAKVLAWNGEPDKALAIFQEIEAKGLDDEASLALADIYVIRKEYSKAEPFYENFLTKHPNDHAVRIRLADLLTWAKQYDRAIDQFEKILAARPDDIQVRRKYARVLGWAGRREEAIANLRKTLGK